MSDYVLREINKGNKYLTEKKSLKWMRFGKNNDVLQS